ncbi:DbpA RNA binding domain-containing protein [Spirochaeta africana]|uniref:DbpA RNA binding domain protein n=1 Tax=Spirochaeta africana (strain ATCC 700263 / DSM 8902 / Z-7692) TaxID=889378 RepID=H9UKQ2_SPIAZ|nr:DbpA RNA binding domain-containing protein [Spirochaeta africana]AFG38095.1 DbpA RNA binding domain protein [Spirochaeta africana DSM 8902]
MATRELPSQDNELIIAKIEELLQQIQYQEDPAEMDTLRRLYKKHVPIFRRSYFSALLIRELARTQGVRFSSPSGKPAKASRSDARRAAKAEAEQRKAEVKRLAKQASSRSASRNDEPSTTPGDGEDPNTIFISIGKNRRVFPRDLIGLFSSVDGVDPEKIGDIRILDNYSFVTVDPSIAPGLITALHNSDYRGRKLTVNFARKKG